MNKIIKLLLNITLFFGLFIFSFGNSFACNDFFCLWNDTPEIQYCKWNECWINQWIDVVKNWVTWIEKNKTFSQYIQSVIAYLIGFLFLIGLIWVLYAWFTILTSSWEEAKVKKSKSIIAYVIIWLVIIFLAYSIVSFIMQVLNVAKV